MLGVAESNGYGYAEKHQHPIDLRDVNLTVDLIRRVDNLHFGETTQDLALIYY